MVPAAAGGRKSYQDVSVVRFWRRPSSWFIDHCLAISSYSSEKETISCVFLVRALISSVKAPPSWPSWPPKGMFMGSQSCPTICNPMDCSPPGFSVYGVLQARILEWVAISYSSESPNLTLGSRASTYEFGVGEHKHPSPGSAVHL